MVDLSAFDVPRDFDRFVTVNPINDSRTPIEASRRIRRAYWLGTVAGVLFVIPMIGLFLGEYLLSGFGFLLCAAMLVGNRIAADKGP